MPAKYPNCLSWSAKAHTNNTAGRVTPGQQTRASADINFGYLRRQRHARRRSEGVVGIVLARKLAARLKAAGLIASETLPGDDVTEDALPEFVKEHAWGHHASYLPHRTARGWRVVQRLRARGQRPARRDASVFPASRVSSSAPVYDRQKAADVIGVEAATTPALGRTVHTLRIADCSSDCRIQIGRDAAINIQFAINPQSPINLQSELCNHNASRAAWIQDVEFDVVS
jgi:hypothetical protein